MPDSAGAPGTTSVPGATAPATFKLGADRELGAEDVERLGESFLFQLARRRIREGLAR